MSQNDTARGRLSQEAADVVAEYAAEQGRTKKEMLTEMVHAYDQYRGTIESNAEKLDMLLETMTDQGAERAVSAGESDSSGGSESSVATDGAVASVPSLDSLSIPHNVELEPGDGWEEQCKQNRKNRMAAIQGFINARLVDGADRVPKAVLVAAMDEGFDVRPRSHRRYLNEWGPEEGLLYPDVRMQSCWSQSRVYDAMVTERADQKGTLRSVIAENTDGVESMLSNGAVVPSAGVELYYLSESARREAMDTLLEDSIECATSGGGVQAYTFLSYVLSVLESEGLVSESRAAQVRTDYADVPGFRTDW